MIIEVVMTMMLLLLMNMVIRKKDKKDSKFPLSVYQQYTTTDEKGRTVIEEGRAVFDGDPIVPCIFSNHYELYLTVVANKNTDRYNLHHLYGDSTTKLKLMRENEVRVHKTIGSVSFPLGCVHVCAQLILMMNE
jgi:hypothetical protein